MPLHGRDPLPHASASLNQTAAFAALDIVRFAAIFDACPHPGAVGPPKQPIRVCFNLLPLGSSSRVPSQFGQLFDDNQRHRLVHNDG